MVRILAVAINTFREAVRDRVLYGVLGVALGLLLFTLVLAEVSLDQQRRIVLDVGLASISLFSVVVAVFLGSAMLYKEIERKTLYVILPKPLRRHEFLLGKYFGISLTALVFVCIMGAVQLLVTAAQAQVDPLLALGSVVGLVALLVLWVWKARDRTAVIVPWSLVCVVVAAFVLSRTEAAIVPILYALVLVLGEVLVLTAVAMFFSSFSTPFLTAMFTTGVWITGRSADTMATMKSQAIPQVVRDALKGLVEIWPNFNLFVPGAHTLNNPLAAGAGPLSYVVTTMAYAAAYSAVLLLLAALIFRRRDFL